MGYSGGTTKNPSYHTIGDHSETIQIDYDPAKVSYQELLEIFWASHDGSERPWSTQYKAAVFYHNEEQKRLAEITRDREASRKKTKIFTEILPACEFYIAEQYHQKYRLRHERELMDEFRRMYSSEEDFTNSTAAARFNGFLDGYGNPESLQAELKDLGLSGESKKKLIDLIKNRKKGFRFF